MFFKSTKATSPTSDIMQSKAIKSFPTPFATNHIVFLFNQHTNHATRFYYHATCKYTPWIFKACKLYGIWPSLSLKPTTELSVKKLATASVSEQ